MEAITFSLSRRKNPPAGCSRLGSAVWSAKIAALLIVFSAAAFLLSYSFILLLLPPLRSSPPALWLATNLIILAVWRLSAANEHRLDREEPPPPPPLPPPEFEPEIETRFYSSLDWEEAERMSEDEVDVALSEEETGFSASSEDESKRAKKVETQDRDDASMDDTWRAIVRRTAPAGATRAVLTKSETWERRLERAAAAAAAAVLRKSATCREGRDGRNEEAAAGWRRREALVVAHDELFRRVETFIKKHHDHLKLQRQESELQRRFAEKRFLSPPRPSQTTEPVR